MRRNSHATLDGKLCYFCRVFKNDRLIATFRYNTGVATSSINWVFFRSVLHEKNINPQLIRAIALCSVVPHLDYTIQSACFKYFKLKPFVLQPGVKTGLKIEYNNPLEVGLTHCQRYGRDKAVSRQAHDDCRFGYGYDILCY